MTSSLRIPIPCGGCPSAQDMAKVIRTLSLLKVSTHTFVNIPSPIRSTWVFRCLFVPLSCRLTIGTHLLQGSYLNTTVDGRNPAPVDRWLIPLFLGFQPSFWWCRISQPSTVAWGNMSSWKKCWKSHSILMVIRFTRYKSPASECYPTSISKS